MHRSREQGRSYGAPDVAFPSGRDRRPAGGRGCITPTLPCRAAACRHYRHGGLPPRRLVSPCTRVIRWQLAPRPMAMGGGQLGRTCLEGFAAGCPPEISRMTAGAGILCTMLHEAAFPVACPTPMCGAPFQRDEVPCSPRGGSSCGPRSPNSTGGSPVGEPVPAPTPCGPRQHPGTAAVAAGMVVARTCMLRTDRTARTAPVSSYRGSLFVGSQKVFRPRGQKTAMPVQDMVV